MPDRAAHPFNPDPAAPHLCMCGQTELDALHDPYRQEPST